MSDGRGPEADAPSPGADALSPGAGALSPGDFLRAHGPQAIDWAASYLDRVGTLPVLAQVRPGELSARLPDAAPERGESFEAVLADLDQILLPAVTHWQHPRYFAYFPSNTSAPAILAEMLAATLNNVGFLWRSSPALTELELVVMSWAAQLLGLPSGWHGQIEDGGSTATLTAAIAARRLTGRQKLVCSAETHSSAEKAARMLGMEVRTVGCDAQGRMLVAELGDLSDTALVVATVGTTGRGAVDPVAQIAGACRRHGAWLHVDAAYAGSAMVCPEFRWAFAGVELADSVVVNAHKWMLTPMDCSLLWSSRPEALRDAFSLVAEYLRTPAAEDDWALSEYGPALGRRFRALKLWAVLRCYGREGLQAHIREGVRMAAQFACWVAEAADWELAAERHFGLVCFRHRAGERFNRELLERVNSSGEAFLSHTVIDGRHTLRLASGGLLTTDADMSRVWELLQREALALSRAPGGTAR